MRFWSHNYSYLLSIIINSDLEILKTYICSSLLISNNFIRTLQVLRLFCGDFRDWTLVYWSFLIPKLFALFAVDEVEDIEVLTSSFQVLRKFTFCLLLHYLFTCTVKSLLNWIFYLFNKNNVFYWLLLLSVELEWVEKASKLVTF